MSLVIGWLAGGMSFVIGWWAGGRSLVIGWLAGGMSLVIGCWAGAMSLEVNCLERELGRLGKALGGEGQQLYLQEKVRYKQSVICPGIKQIFLRVGNSLLKKQLSHLNYSS